MQRFYGNRIVGVWCFPDGSSMFPRELEERQDEFFWQGKDDERNDIPFLWPSINGVPLVYDEEA